MSNETERTELVINLEGKYNAAAEVKKPGKRELSSKLNEIRTKIEDTNISQAELSKLIALEMASILDGMNEHLDNPTSGIKGMDANLAIKSLSEQLKGVRELGRQIIEMDNQAKRDFINFDGEKFQFVAGQWLQMGVEALRSMGWDEHTVTSYVKQFRSQIEMNELRIRREAENIGTNKQK
jgi:hypothetical protein